jgi:hypothetical protein
MKRPAELPSSQEIPATHLALYRRLATAFILLTVVVAGLVFYVVWSKATVIVLSRQEEVRAEFIADVAPEPTGGEIKGDIMIKEAELTDTFDSAISAETETYAEGRVRITSTLSRPQTLVATTRLLTPDEKLFRLRDRVLVPANGFIEVDIFSDGVGKDYDIGEATFVIPGLNPTLRERFTVETVEPISGGVTRTRLVTKALVEQATEELRDRLYDQLEAELREAAVAAGAPTSGEIVHLETLTQDVTPAIGSEADTFKLTVSVKATGVFFNRQQLDRLAEARVKEIVPFGRQLRAVEEGATSVRIEKTDLASSRINLRVAALGTAVLSTDAPALDPSKLTNVSRDAAVEYLEQVTGVASASVKLSPFWSTRLPSVADNIVIEVR